MLLLVSSSTINSIVARYFPDDAWLSIVLGALVSFVLLIMSILAYIQVNGFVNDYENVVDSWQTQPISDISIGNGCTSDAVTLGAYWPGMSASTSLHISAYQYGSLHST